LFSGDQMARVARQGLLIVFMQNRITAIALSLSVEPPCGLLGTQASTINE
jgi:hypothetical protein